MQTEYGAKTMALDPKTHNLLVDTSDFDPPDATAQQPNPQRRPNPGTSHLLIYGRCRPQGSFSAEPGACDGSRRRKRNSPDREMASGCTLDKIRESKMEVPVSIIAATAIAGSLGSGG